MAVLRNEADRGRWWAFVHAQEFPIEVECKPFRKRRSNEQNAYLWRAIYQPLVEVAGHTKDEWHEWACGERWGWIESELPGGRKESRPARTTTKGLDGKRNVLTADEFRGFVRFLEAKLSEMGIFVQEEWQG